ncbi:hypothetical protein RYX56_14275 [Alkalihalophilus lindianensis]|uniref:YqxM protein n=1 Tax=Alkalihalophilus lindianensis TaxID=1630542 RepID=A0ABU3XDL7_9BACI|nr:hypothetical protein [Alkalihalophilus lindianensis]MDV2685529.1 hypothetical protein [Alkalihalophilus lindianensis]
MLKKLSGQERFIIITAVFALMFMYSSILFSGEISIKEETVVEAETIAQQSDLLNNEEAPLTNGTIIQANQLDSLEKETEELYAYAYEKTSKDDK